MKSIFLFFLSITAFCLHAQTIEFFADVMINADNGAHRVYAAEKFGELLHNELKKENSFSYSFEQMPWISVQESDDKTIRVISWQVDQGDGQFSYHGYLQSQSGSSIPFGRANGKDTHKGNDEIPVGDWSGALVYKILTPSPGEHYLLTFQMTDEFTKVKTLEPLQLKGEHYVLGKKNLFTGEDQTGLTARLSLSYSMDANGSITYDEASGRFIYDNLVVVQGRIPGQGPTMVPDGSYKAFEKQEDGSWAYVDKLYTQWNEGALDPDGRSRLQKDLFKKNKN